MPRMRTGASTRMSMAADGDDLILVDLSHAGCAVQARHAFSPGDELHVTFTVDTCVAFIVPVRTVYTRLTSHRHPPGFAYLIGFEFVTARQPDLHRIVEILLEAMEEPLSVH